jgi:ABC-type sugar transport system ATPase subunit
MAKVTVKDIRKTFGGTTKVLEGISFDVSDGEFVSLLGPSGCGKTTLLRIIAGLEYADSGELRIGEREVSRTHPKDRDIAMVFQNYALYPHLLVSENIGMGLKLRKFPPEEIEARTTEAARMLDLEPLLERKPAALSGGQRQRVALARALVRQPKVTLLDEPLSNLDAVLRERTRGELKILFKKIKGTAIYVTHDQVEAMTLSDKIVVLNKGRIQQVGTPYQIYHEPANTFVAKFLGAPPMNIVPAKRVLDAGFGFDIPGEPKQRLVGVRPEDLVVRPETSEGAVEFEVTLREPTGAQTVLSLQKDDFVLRASLTGEWEEGRARAFVSMPSDAAKIRFFDAATEESC